MLVFFCFVGRYLFSFFLDSTCITIIVRRDNCAVKENHTTAIKSTGYDRDWCHESPYRHRGRGVRKKDLYNVGHYWEIDRRSRTNTSKTPLVFTGVCVCLGTRLQRGVNPQQRKFTIGLQLVKYTCTY